MNDKEMAVKLAFIFAGLIGAIALGYLVIFVIAPLFILATIIDFGMRQTYNKKLTSVQSSAELTEGPRIHSFDARYHEGEIVVGWLLDLPRDAVLDIYRTNDHGGGSIENIDERGVCIHTTGVEFTNSMDDAFIDKGLPDGTYYYVPVVSGTEVVKEPLSYHFLDFAKEVRFRTRRKQRRYRGEAVAVTTTPEAKKEIEDSRDEATKIADGVLAHFRERKKFDADLDAAISRIKESNELNEEEKQEAIELIETRAAPT